MRQAQRSVPRRVLSKLLLACLIGGALAGCGQKGDLYLPDKPEQRPAPEDDNSTT